MRKPKASPRRRWGLPAAWLAGAAALVADGLLEWVWTLDLQANGPRGLSYGEAYYVVANWRYGLSVLAMFTIFAGVYLLLDTLIRADYRRLFGWGHFALTVAGMALVFEPVWWLRLGGLPRRYEDYPTVFQTANALSRVGYALTLVGQVLFVGVLGSLLLRWFSPRLSRSGKPAWIATRRLGATSAISKPPCPRLVASSRPTSPPISSASANA